MKYKGNSVLCTKSEAEKIIKDMQQRANEEVCSLQFLFGYKAPIVPRVYAREYPMGFAVESDLYYDGELLRHYPIPEEMLIDLIWLSIKKMGKIKRSDSGMAERSLLKLYDHGEDYEIALKTASYVSGGNLAIAMEYFDSEYNQLMPYAVLTVNLLDKQCKENCAFVDVNNLGTEILEWISANKLGVPTGRYAKSGFCTYPEIKFDIDEVKKYANV